MPLPTRPGRDPGEPAPSLRDVPSKGAVTLSRFMHRAHVVALPMLVLASCGAPEHHVASTPATSATAQPSDPYACAAYHRWSTPTDSDADGVPDKLDACPCEPGPAMPDDTDAV